MNHAALPCGLPFATPSPPCLPSSLVHLTLHPLSPLPRPCLNLLKRRCWLTAVISHHARDSFMCHKRSIRTVQKPTGSLWILTPWRGGRGPAIPGPANTVMVYIRLLGDCADEPSVCPREGSRGYVHQLAKRTTVASGSLEVQCHGSWHKQAIESMACVLLSDALAE